MNGNWTDTRCAGGSPRTGTPNCSACEARGTPDRRFRARLLGAGCPRTCGHIGEGHRPGSAGRGHTETAHRTPAPANQRSLRSTALDCRIRRPNVDSDVTGGPAAGERREVPFGAPVATATLVVLAHRSVPFRGHSTPIPAPWRARDEAPLCVGCAPPSAILLVRVRSQTELFKTVA